MGALDNIRVIDFGHFVAGPVTGMLLADQGADVIKIEPPDGARYRGEANATWNRGKRSIALDLKDPGDLEIARGLAERADVLIENFRPGVMDRLGLGDAELRVRNRRLVYAAMPAFGPEDTRSAHQGWEGAVLAAVDCFRPPARYREMVQQLHRRPADRTGDPVFTAEPMASMFAALIGSTAIAAALNLREQTGEGQRVEVPLFDAAIQAAGIFAMAQLPFKPAFGSAMNPWDHQYRCADGRWIQIVCNDPEHAEALAGLLERPDFVERGMTQRRLPDTATEHELILALTETFAGRDAAEWEGLLCDEGLPAAICRTPAEWLDHPHATGHGLLVDVDDPTLGHTRQPAPAVELSRSAAPVIRPAPVHDQHHEEIAAELAAAGPVERRVTTPNSPVQGPLAGIRVLDLGTLLAAPTCGRTLAELGAEVIKIDDPTRGGVLYHHDVNRGKRSLLLDLEDDEGHALFWDLLGTADVVIESFNPGEARELELDYETIRAERPDIVYVSLSAYDEEGPWSDLEGHGETVQALTGMQHRYGGPDAPAIWPFAMTIDYAAGYAAAYGAVLALLDREVTGEGQRVTTSLVRAAGVLQSTFLIDHGAKAWDEPSGPDARGFGPTQQLYRCEDGWVFLGATDAAKLEPVLGDPGPDPADAIASWCQGRSAADAVEHLVKHGMGAHEVTWLNDALMDPVVVRRGLTVIRDHGRLGLLRTTGPAPWFSRSMVSAGRPAPSPGADAASILAEINRDGDIEQLAAAGAIGLPGT